MTTYVFSKYAEGWCVICCYHLWCGAGETTSCPCLSSAGQGPQWDGQFVKWQDMPTNCITSASVAEDNGPPYAEVGKWMDLICAGTPSPHSPRPCWGLRGTEADTDRRAHPLPHRIAAVHHRIPLSRHAHHWICYLVYGKLIMNDRLVELL